MTLEAMAETGERPGFVEWSRVGTFMATDGVTEGGGPQAASATQHARP